MLAEQETVFDCRVVLPQATEKIVVRPGATIRELIDEHIPIHLRPYIEVFNHGSRIIDVDSVRAVESDRLLFAVIPQGGEGAGKQILAAVLMIVVAVVAWQVAPIIVGQASGMAVNAVAAGITMIGSMVISALIKPPSIKPASEKAEVAGSNPFTGQSNQARPYQPILKLYGRHKIFPPIAATPIIDNYGINSVISTLYDFGLGAVVIDGMEIGDAPVGEYDPDIVSHYNTKTPQLAYVNHRAGYDNFSYTLKEGIEFIARTKPDAASATATISFPTGLAHYNEKGEILLDGHFVGMTISYRRVGTNDPWLSKGISANGGGYYVATTVSDGMTELTPEIPRRDMYLSTMLGEAKHGGFVDCYLYPADSYVFQMFNLYGYDPELRYTHDFSAVPLYIDSRTGMPVICIPVPAAFINDPAAITSIVGSPSVPLLSVYVPATYGYVEGGVGVRGWMEKPFVVAVTFVFPTPGEYDIRFFRNTPDTYDVRRKLDMTTLSLLKSNLNGGVLALQKRHTMLEMRLVASEKLSGVVQNFSAMGTSVLPHYDAAGNLIGEFQTRNPANICLDILLGEANPNPLKHDQIDWSSWSRLAAVCNQPRTRIINGVSITRERFTCDVIVDYRTTANELLLSILSGCHASLMVTQDGKYGVFIDEEQTIPRQLLTPANSWGFSGNRQFPQKPHALRVAYTDGDRTAGAGLANWQRGEAIIYADGYNAANAEIYEELNTFGITDYASAWAFGRYMLAQGIQRAETFVITMDIEHLASQRGDLVLVAHDVPKIGGQPARVVSVTGDVVKVSMPLSVVPTGYAVRLQSGTTRTGAVVASINADEFQLDTAVNITEGDLLVLGMMDRVVNEYLIQAIQPKSNFEADLTLVKYVKEIYSADIAPIPEWKPDFGDDLINGTDLAVINLEATQTLQYIDRRPFANFDLSWGISGFAFDHALIYVTLPSGRVEKVGESTDGRIDWDVDLLADAIKIGPVQFEVIPVSATGYQGRSAKLNAIVAPDRTPPKPVREFGVNVQDMTVAIFWEAPVEQDIDIYEVRYSPRVVGAVWNSSQLVGQFAHDVTRTMVGAREGTYFIRVRDTSGNWSSEVFRRTTLEQLPNINLVATVNDAVIGWPGALSGTVVSGSDVMLDGDFGSVQPEGYYYFQQFVDLGDVYEVRVSSKLQSHGSMMDDYMHMWIPLASAKPLARSPSSLYNVTLEYRTADSVTVMADWVPNLADPIADPIAGALASNWSAWRPIEVGDITGRLIQFRVKFESLSPYVKAILDDGLVEIDVPDRIWRQSDVAVPAAGISIVFVPPFQAIPTLAVTTENSQAIGHQITNKSRAGFDIQLFDETGPVAGQIDVAALGYGRERTTSI